MIKFKVCPRCRGDLYLTEDIFGKYFSCFQCGYLKDVADVPAMQGEDLNPKVVVRKDAA